MFYFLIFSLPAAIFLQFSFLPRLPWGLWAINLVLLVLFFILWQKPLWGTGLTLVVSLLLEAYADRLWLTNFFSFLLPLGLALAAFHLFPWLRFPRDFGDYFFLIIFFQGLISLSLAPVYFYGDFRLWQIGQTLIWSSIGLGLFLLFSSAYEAYSQSFFHSFQRSKSS